MVLRWLQKRGVSNTAISRYAGSRLRGNDSANHVVILIEYAYKLTGSHQHEAPLLYLPASATAATAAAAGEPAAGEAAAAPAARGRRS